MAGGNRLAFLLLLQLSRGASVMDTMGSWAFFTTLNVMAGFFTLCCCVAVVADAVLWGVLFS